MLTTRPRGTNDILPDEIHSWRFLEKTIHQICKEYGYKEIRTPIFEHTELFVRGVGDTTDIVEKEMYSFLDQSHRQLTLRPEGTAPTVRAFLENNLQKQLLPGKVYYLGPMFRYGRPQAGRYRQFHQFGVEAFGSNDPALDAEIIILAMDFYRRLGLKNLKLLLNSVGCPECRKKHRHLLQVHLEPVLGELCDTCQNRYEKNPLRIFDCKNVHCQRLVLNSPTIVDSLCESCSEHFKLVQTYLGEAGVVFQLDPRLVRGLDYYTHTAFEILVEGIGAQNAIGGGGRYNGLLEELGGKSLPGIGFGLGLERILLALQEQGVELQAEDKPHLFIATMNAEAKLMGFKLQAELRKRGFRVEMDYLERSIKAQLKYAGRQEYQFVAILGESELADESVALKKMETGEQITIPLAELNTYLKDALKI
ncbi:MAG: histidine--tRNA ligase [Bacillota bacterium]